MAIRVLLQDEIHCLDIYKYTKKKKSIIPLLNNSSSTPANINIRVTIAKFILNIIRK